MKGRGGHFSVCMWNAAVCGEGEGLTLSGIVSLEILHQASSVWSSGSKYSSPFFALLWSQKPDFWALPLSKGSAHRLEGESARLGYYSLQGLSDWPWSLCDAHSSCQAVILNSTLYQGQVSIPHLPLSGLGAGRTCPTQTPSLLAQRTAVSLVAFLCPAHLFVNNPFLKFPSSYHNWRALFPAGTLTDKRCRFLCNTAKLTGSWRTDFWLQL